MFQRLNTAMGRLEERKGFEWILAAALLLAGVGLRLYRIGEETIWLDEFITWHNIDLPTLSEYIAQLRQKDATFVPAYYVLLYFWAGATQYSVTAARILSVAAGMSSAVFVYLLGRRAFGRAAGLTALAFMVFSAPHVYYAQEIRVYALYVAAAALSVLTFHVALERSSRTLWALHCGANAVLALSHYFGALIIMTEAAYWLLYHRRPLGRLCCWFAAQAVLALLLAWWMLGIDREMLRITTDFLRPPPISDALKSYLWLAAYWPRPWHEIFRPALLIVALLAWFSLRVFRQRKHDEIGGKRRRAWVLCFLWLLLPLSMVLAATYLGRPCATLRYVLPGSLPFFLLVGGAVGALPWRWLRWTTAALLIALPAGQLAVEGRPFRPNMDRAGAIIQENSGPRDALLLGVGMLPQYRASFAFISDDRIHAYHDAAIAPRAAGLLDDYDAVWLLYMWDYGGDDPGQALPVEAYCAEHGLPQETTLISSGHHVFLGIFAWPSQVNIGRALILHHIRRGDSAHKATAPTEGQP